MRPLQFISLVLFLFSSPCAWAMGHLSEQTVDSPLIGKFAPDAFLKNTRGITASIIDWRQGEKAILIFWATWCPHCTQELGAINNNFESIKQKGIKVIMVDLGETKEDVKNYLNQRKIGLMSFVDENSYLQQPYHLIGVPTLIFIDEKGIIRNITHAFPSNYEDYFGVK